MIDDYRPNRVVEVFEWLAENWFGALLFLYLATCVVRWGWD